MAPSLKVRRTCVIGVVIPDVTNPFYAEVMRGVEDEARICGYSVIFCNTNENPELEREYLNTLFARRVDGVIIASDTVNLGEHRLAKQRFPMVFFDRTPPAFSGAAVVTNNLEASREATRHLINLGHTRIAIIAGWKELSVAMLRLEGFREALQEAGIPLQEAYVKLGDFNKFESGYRKGRELMMLPTPPTAIFCGNNRIALGLMRALGELNINCPDQVSVLAFDDFEWISSFRPYLTTVAQPTHLMGKRATEILVRKMQKATDQPDDAEDHIVVLPNELRIRESTAPPYCTLAGAVVECQD